MGGYDKRYGVTWVSRAVTLRPMKGTAYVAMSHPMGGYDETQEFLSIMLRCEPSVGWLRQDALP